LPPVAFYKPAGFQNQHPDYSNIVTADREVRRVVELMKKSPMRNSYAIIITYDEFGGSFDHAKPPIGAAAGANADYFGPGPRIPAIVVSPLLSKRGIDSTPYQTSSIAKLIVDRFGLEPLPSPRFGAVESLARVFDGGAP
jgi:phospholipase C